MAFFRQVATLIIRLVYKLLRGYPLIPKGLALKFLNSSALIVTLAIYRHFYIVGTPQRDVRGNVAHSGEDLDGQGVIEWAWDT